MTDSSRLIYDPDLSTMQRVGSQEDLLFRSSGDSVPWRDWRNWSKRQKIIAATGAAMAILLVVSMIGVGVIYAAKSSAVVPTPTTVAPPPAPVPPTNATTTTTSTTTTTPATTTTTVPTTATTKATTTTGPTTTSTTTAKPTTTSPAPTTTWRPKVNPCEPLPSDPYKVPAPVLLDNLCSRVLKLTFESFDCAKPKRQPLPVFRCVLTITDHNTNHTFAADGNEKKLAKTAVAIIAAEQIFGLNYTAHNMTVPPPLYPCTPIPSTVEQESMDFQGLSGDSSEDVLETTTPETPTTTYHPSTVKPLPDDPTKLSAVTLLDYMKDYLPQNYTSIQCRTSIPPVFRVQLTINETHTFMGDSDTKRHAKEEAAREAVHEMFGVDYSHSTVIPKPPTPCDPIGLAQPYSDEQ